MTFPKYFRVLCAQALLVLLLVACKEDSAVAPVARQAAAEPSLVAVTPAPVPPSVSAEVTDTNKVVVGGFTIPNICCYHVYWATSPGVVPSPSNLLTSGSPPKVIHVPLAPGTYYYVMAGVDDAGVEGPLSTEVHATVHRDFKKLSFASPRVSQVVMTDSVFVEMNLTSVWQIASVTAKVGTQQVALSFAGTTWRGWVPLPPGPPTTRLLSVTAIDVQGGLAESSIAFLHDHAPTVVVQSPNDSTYSPATVRVTATCADDAPGGCVKLEATIGGAIVATGVSSIDQNVSVAAYDGQTIPIQFVGYDARDTTIISKTIIVDVNPHLQLLANAAGIILDFQIGPPRVLARVTTNGTTQLRIQTQTTSTTIWSSPTVKKISQGYLTPQGAIFVPDGTPVRDTVFEWRGSTLVNLGPSNPGTLVVKGSWAVWSNQVANFDVLLRRSLAPGVTTQVANDSDCGHDVAANGVVVYCGASDLDIYRVSGSTTTRLTNDPGNTWNIDPRTDGTLVTYAKCYQSCTTSAVALHDGTTETLLTPTRFGQVRADFDYRVTKGWAGFTQYAGAFVQVFTRSPAGTIQQVSFFGAPCLMGQLSSTGEVVFYCGTRQYRAAAGVAAVDIGARHTPLFRAGGLYELVGRSLLRVQ